MASISKPSRVDRAFERLERALTRLESAAHSRADVTPGGDGVELQGLRNENARLQAVTQEVGGRLDDAIGRLEKALGE